MARIRTIKPGFFTSVTVAEASCEARLTFIGLWTHVDDEGRCVDNAHLVKAALWPLDEGVTAANVGDWLAELERLSLIVRYEVGGRKYLQVSNFEEHQRINKPQPSKIPAPSGTPLPDHSATVHGMVAVGSGRERKGKEEEGKGEGTRTHARARVREALPDLARPSFDALLRSARNPDSLCAVLESLHRPITGGHPPYSWDTIGAALVDYAGKSPPEFSAKLLRAICADFTAHPLTVIPGETERDRARREALANPPVYDDPPAPQVA